MSFTNQTYYDIPPIETADILVINQPITVLYTHDGLGEEQKQLLAKILSSVQQELDTARVQEISKDKRYRITGDKETLILSFGIHPKVLSLQVDTKPYKLRRIGNTSYLFSRSLNKLPSYAEERRALWTSLKAYYKLP